MLTIEECKKFIDDSERYSDEEIFDIGNNLIGFFNLLLEVDMRNNPELYKKDNKEIK